MRSLVSSVTGLLSSGLRPPQKALLEESPGATANNLGHWQTSI